MQFGYGTPLALLLSILLSVGDTVVGFAAPRAPIQVGQKIPWADLHWGFPPEKINVPLYTAERSLIVVGVSGAFLPNKAVPSYLDPENQKILKDEIDIKEVLIYGVNDGAVMSAYAIKSKMQGSIVSMMADPSGEFTFECGMQQSPLDTRFGTIARSKPFAMYVVNNIVKHVAIADGDHAPEDVTCAPAMIQAIRTLNEATKTDEKKEEIAMSR